VERKLDVDKSASGASILHPDLVVGVLSEIAHRLAKPPANTLADADRYAGMPLKKLFPAPKKLPRLTVTARWRLPGIVSEDIVFRSLHQPLDAKFRRRYEDDYRATHLVYARRIRPAGVRRRPRLLYLHGYMQPETYIEEFSLLAGMALMLNVEVVQMQPPYHGRRTPRGSLFSGDLYWTADVVRSIEALRQTFLDARTLLSCLLAEDDRPVGVSGLSLGGALTLGLTCLEDRFSFSIPLVAHMDLAALVADAPVLSKMRRDLRSFGWEREDFDSFVDNLGWYDLQPQLPAEKILLFAASQDRFFDPRVVEKMWRQWGKPSIHWHPTSHMGFITQFPAVARAMRAFLDDAVLAG
jgi:hypothetical protein